MKEIGVALENLKQWVFGTTIQPAVSEATLLKVIFWPDAFLLCSLLFAVLLVVAIFLFSRKVTRLKIKSNAATVLALLFFRLVCFVGLVGTASATARMFFFLFGERTASGGNEAAVTAFTILFLIPAILCSALVLACGMAMVFLLGVKLQK